MCSIGRKREVSLLLKIYNFVNYKNRNLLKYTNSGVHVDSFKKSGGLQADQSRIHGRKRQCRL